MKGRGIYYTKMRTYTHITYTKNQGEISATLMRLDEVIGSFDIIGTWTDNQDIVQSLDDEASRTGYIKVSFRSAVMSDNGRTSSRNMTPEQRIERAKKAVNAREAKKNINLAPQRAEKEGI